MYTKMCPVCNSNFEVVNPRYKYCSDKCRKEIERRNSRERAKLYHHSVIGKLKHHQYHKQHYQPVNSGSPLLDGRATWCLDCLFDDYATTKSIAAYQRLACRGYDKEMILAELENRNG